MSFSVDMAGRADMDLALDGPATSAGLQTRPARPSYERQPWRPAGWAMILKIAAPPMGGEES